MAISSLPAGVRPAWTTHYAAGVPAEISPRWTTAIDLFEHAYRSLPDDPGALYFDTSLTFGELGERAHAFAFALTEKYGVRVGDRVAVILQNVPAVPVVIHGAFLAGAVVVPISAMLTPTEICRYLDDVSARVLVCLSSVHASLGQGLGATPVEHVVTVSELDDLETVPALLAGHERIADSNADALTDLVRTWRGADFTPPEVQGSDPALMAFTSGTTGISKAAVLSHSAVVAAAESIRVWTQIDESDVVVAVAPMFHITGLTGHLAASRAAGSPLLLSYRFEPGEMMRLIEQWRGTWMLGPATAFLSLMQHPDFATRDLASLVKLHSGGAPLPTSVVEKFEAATGQYIQNVYGLTETATPCHGVPPGRRSPVDSVSGTLSVGVPLPGVDARIVSHDGIEVADGEEGELVISSPTVAQGYWERPDETAHAFRDGWFHTGDLAKRDGDGYFYIVDRIKDMIIASGFKISPRDVEEVLFQHPAVLDAAVIGVPDDYRGETVKAFVVAKDGSELTPEVVRDFCAERLASFKVPRHVELISEIPRNAAGKALRRSLRDRPTNPR